MCINLYDPTTHISFGIRFFFRTYSLSNLNPTNALTAFLVPVLNLKLNCFALASINSTFSLTPFLTVLRELFINRRVSLQGLLGNASFVALFLAMTFYWIDTSFHSFLPNTTKHNLKGGTICMTIANGILVILLLLRWQVSGHFPLSNLYESLMFLCWSCTSIHFLILNTLPSTDFLIAKLIGCITSPCALMMNAYASFSLPKDMQNAAPLVPALQSNWLMMHVTVMILSYAALIVGSLLAIAFLIVSAWASTEPSTVIGSEQHIANGPKAYMEFSSNNDGFVTSPNRSPSLMSVKSTPFLRTGATVESSSMFDNVAPMVQLNTELMHPELPQNLDSFKNLKENTKCTETYRQKLMKNLDNLSYRLLGVGFPFLTIGILSGAVWANEAWGSYWSWDPKETWALLTWLVFAIYLHTRLTKGWEGQKPAIIASFGFIVVWVCFLGVNLIGEGLHSYGWLS